MSSIAQQLTENDDEYVSHVLVIVDIAVEAPYLGQRIGPRLLLATLDTPRRRDELTTNRHRSSRY